MSRADPGFTAQRAFLANSLAHKPDGATLVQVVLSFTGAFAPDRFLAGLQALIARHDMLRRVFTMTADGVATAIAAAATAPVETLDWRTLDSSLADTLFSDLLIEDRGIGFNPAVAPLLRACCVLLPGEESRVLLSSHHLLMDGISRDALLTAWVTLYDTGRMGETLPIRAPEAMAPACREDRAFWQNALAGLGNDNPLAAMQTARSQASAAQSVARAEISPHTRAALLTLAATLKTSLAMIAYAAWAVCLHRLSHADDIAFLTIRNLRATPGMARGHDLRSLVNTVPLRVRVRPDQTVAELVAAVEAFWNASRPHAAAGLAHILAWCGLDERVWPSNMLFTHDRFSAWFARSAPAGTQRRLDRLRASDTPLTLAVTRGDGLDIALQYWTDSFHPGAIDALLESLTTLLAGMAANPYDTIGNLPFIGAAQRDFIEAAAQGPVRPEAAGLLLHAGFADHAARTPERLALADEDEGLTYGALHAASNALAQRLLDWGVERESPVAVLAERGPEYLIAILAILKAGAAFLPLSAAHPDPELRRILQAAGVTRSVAQPNLAPRLAGLGYAVLRLEPNVLSGRAAKPPSIAIRPDHLAYLVSTSGTTGTPKIVEIEHRAAANMVRHSLDAVYADGDLDLVPWSDTLVGDAGLHQIFAPLSRGGTLVPVSNFAKLKASGRFGLFTAFGATPSMLANLLNVSALPPNLRAVMFGGEACPAGLSQRLRDETEIRRAINAYGPTEAAIYCTADDVMAPAIAAARTIGRPIANMRVEILDERLHAVPPGTMGEICISGVGLARGYRGRPDLTEAAFPTAIGHDGTRRRIYRSGDLGVLLPDGRLAFHGRRDRQVKIGGWRVELDGVEQVLQGLPGVRQAVASAVADSAGEQRLVAWVVATPGTDCSEAGLREQMRRLAPAAMTPNAIVRVDEIRLTPAGKPDLAALPVPVSRPAEACTDTSEPSSLAALVAATLRLPPGAIGEEAGIDDTPGWDSVHHIMLMLRISETYGIALSDHDMMAATVPAIRAMLGTHGLSA
jgi:amino acid adenylation domain-containing protein